MDAILEMDGLSPAELAELDEAAFEALPFGALRLDAEGRVAAYNAAEARAARMAPGEVLGRRFFEEVAPCADVRAYRGVLDALSARGHGEAHLDFHYRFAWGAARVRIRLVVLSPHQRWILATRIVDK